MEFHQWIKSLVSMTKTFRVRKAIKLIAQIHDRRSKKNKQTRKTTTVLTGQEKCNNVALWSAEGQVFEHLVATVGEGGLWS